MYDPSLVHGHINPVCRAKINDIQRRSTASNDSTGDGLTLSLSKHLVPSTTGGKGSVCGISRFLRSLPNMFDMTPRGTKTTDMSELVQRQHAVWELLLFIVLGLWSSLPTRMQGRQGRFHHDLAIDSTPRPVAGSVGCSLPNEKHACVSSSYRIAHKGHHPQPVQGVIGLWSKFERRPSATATCPCRSSSDMHVGGQSRHSSH